MLEFLTTDGRGAIPLVALSKEKLGAWLARQPAAVRAWVRSAGFAAKPGSACPIPGPGGGMGRALVGVGDAASGGPDGRLWDWAALPPSLPRGRYRIAPEPPAAEAARAALGWALGTYVFERYKKTEKPFATLVWPKRCDRKGVTSAAESTSWVRDLINTPSEDMGPGELAAAARGLARAHGGRCRVIAGQGLLARNYPAIHAVGRASARPPRLIDVTWGRPGRPRLSLVGKGVCFDSGGLDLKTSSGMKLMKKDMGGGAHALGLARMVMDAGLRVRLRVLVPAVENSVSGNALRPLDVVGTRKGLTVEIGNTDAEGRVILADALAEAVREGPDLVIDLATLTGAARVALGGELPALFCNDDAIAERLVRQGDREGDPLWRLPLFQPYAKHVESKVADLTNAPEGSYGGAIIAALFLERFVERKGKPKTPWIHIDLMGWNTSSRPGRPEGGEAMGLRALFGFLRERYGS